MTKVVHPFSHRLGIIRDWKSRWFSSDEKYRSNLKSDLIIREYLDVKLRGLHVGGVDIERNEKAVKVQIKTARPGMIIGRQGEGIEILKKDLLKEMTRKGVGIGAKQDLKVEIEEIRSPESNSKVVAEMIAESLEKRLPFRRVMKQMAEKVMANRDVKGVRIYLGGRLGGADMARSEDMKKGRVPLQTFRADIDYAREKAHMTYGDIGIKVWIYKGEVFNKNEHQAKAKR